MNGQQVLQLDRYEDRTATFVTAPVPPALTGPEDVDVVVHLPKVVWDRLGRPDVLNLTWTIETPGLT